MKHLPVVDVRKHGRNCFRNIYDDAKRFARIEEFGAPAPSFNEIIYMRGNVDQVEFGTWALS